MELGKLKRRNIKNPVTNKRNELPDCLERNSCNKYKNIKTYISPKRTKKKLEEEFSWDIKPFEQVYIKDEGNFQNFDLENIKEEHEDEECDEMDKDGKAVKEDGHHSHINSYDSIHLENKNHDLDCVSVNETKQESELDCEVKEICAISDNDKCGENKETLHRVEVKKTHDNILNKDKISLRQYPKAKRKLALKKTGEENLPVGHAMVPKVESVISDNDKCGENEETLHRVEVKKTRNRILNKDKISSRQCQKAKHKCVLKKSGEENLSVGSVKKTYGRSILSNRSTLKTYSRIPRTGNSKHVKDPLCITGELTSSADCSPSDNCVFVPAVTCRKLHPKSSQYKGVAVESGRNSVKRKEDVIDLSEIRLRDMSHTEKSLLFYPFLRVANVTYTCVVCKNTFSKKNKLTEHVGIHDLPSTEEKTELHECVTCHKYFISKDGLITHLANHDDSLNFKCEICDRYFDNMKTFIQHLMTHNSKNTYKCEFCSQDFPFQKFLVDHILRNHNNSEHYECTVCNVSFCRKSSYSNHIKTVHCSGMYNCRACGATFTTELSLHRHLVTKFIDDTTLI